MSSLFTWLVTIHSPDEDIRRRGRILVILSLGLIILAIVMLTPAFFAPDALPIIVVSTIYIGIFAATLQLGRRGYVTLGSFILCGIILLANLIGLGTNPTGFIEPAYFLVLPMLVAGLLLRPHYIAIVLVITLAGLGGALLLNPAAPLSTPSGQFTAISLGFLLLLVALISGISAYITGSALNATRFARSAAENTAAQLEQVNLTLEQRVQERTADLAEALQTVEQREARLARMVAENDQQRTVIREMSVPAIPINAMTTVMPLIGALDTTRLAYLATVALQVIERRAVRYLVLDITGVPIVDSQVAQGLVHVVRAAQLMGTEILLVGIRPEVAQAVVGLGIDLQVRTYADLEVALHQIKAGPQPHRRHRT